MLVFVDCVFEAIVDLLKFLAFSHKHSAVEHLKTSSRAIHMITVVLGVQWVLCEVDTSTKIVIIAGIVDVEGLFLISINQFRVSRSCSMIQHHFLHRTSFILLYHKISFLLVLLV